MNELLKITNEYRDAVGYASKVARSGLSKMPPLIITCAITGGLHGAELNPNLPETKDAQVQSAYDAYNAGASIVHIHARDPKNLAAMSNDVNDFKEINARIREKCPDLIINNTCLGGRLIAETDKGMVITPNLLSSLDALPELSSIDLTCGSTYMPVKARKAPLTGRDQDGLLKMNYFLTMGEAPMVATEMTKRGIKPELEVYSEYDVLQYVLPMAQKGLFGDDPLWVQMLFGGNGTFPNVESMVNATRILPKNSLFSVIGVGAAQNAMITLAMIMGHHVRVGMEDNPVYGPGELAKSNAQLVERVVRIAKELGRPIATPAQAREMLGLGAPRPYTF